MHGGGSVPRPFYFSLLSPETSRCSIQFSDHIPPAHNGPDIRTWWGRAPSLPSTKDLLYARSQQSPVAWALAPR